MRSVLLILTSALKESERHINFSNQLQGELKAHVLAVATSQCRNLCETMQTLLPRELRDIIYGYLLADECKCDDTKRLENDKNSMRYVPRKRGEHVPNLFDDYPYVRDTEYVGIETRIELAEMWCWLARFTFDFRSKVQEVLAKKIWGLQLDAR